MKKRTVLRSAAALVLTIVMLLALALPALAASGTGSITIDPNGQAKVGGATRFTAFQIFKGEVGTNKNQLVGLTWGDGVESDALVNAMKTSDLPLGLSTFGEVFSADYAKWEGKVLDPNEGYSDQMEEAEFVAQWLGKHIDDTEYADDFARIVADHTKAPGKQSVFNQGETAWVISGLEPGYYLVKDGYKTEEGNTTSDGSVSSYILQVLGTVTVDLKATIPTVEKKVDGKDGVLTETNVDHEFTLTGTVSENIAEYDTYRYEFVDNITAGLTVSDLTGLKVEAQYSGGKRELTLNTDYVVKLDPPDQEGVKHTLTVTIDNLKNALSTKFPGIDLNTKSVVQTIKIVVTYKAKLNEYAVVTDDGNPNDVTLKYSNDPYNESTGETVPDEVNTYTLALRIIKHDEKNQPISDVTFKLMKGSDTSAGNHEYATFKETTAGEPSETYQAITGWVNGPEATAGDVLTTNEQGIFNIHGLSAGTYTLVEISTKKDYELMKPIIFTIEGEVKDDGSLGTVTLKRDPTNEHRQDVTWNNSDFTGHDAQLTLVNYPSPILPHTGGIGAKVVYIVSGLTVLAGAAIVYLAVRKRGRGRHEQAR